MGYKPKTRSDCKRREPREEECTFLILVVRWGVLGYCSKPFRFNSVWQARLTEPKPLVVPRKPALVYTSGPVGLLNRFKHLDHGRLGTLASGGEIQPAKVGREKARARPLHGGDSSHLFVVVGVLLLKNGNRAFAS